MVAHRLSTVQDSDRILLLNDKRLVAMGSHQELMKCNDYYRSLVASQQLAGPRHRPRKPRADARRISTRSSLPCPSHSGPRSILHAVVAFILGAPLLLAPGRSLGLLGWAPVDPLPQASCSAPPCWGSPGAPGAASGRPSGQVAFLVEMEAAFCVLACVGMLRQVWGRNYPYYVWTLLAILALFAVAWLFALVRK